jgi:hypothetical protein
VKMHATPVASLPRTCANIAKRIAKKVDTMAASCGLFPKGTATKKDQLAREKAQRRWTMRIKPALLAVKMRCRHVRATIIQAGKYANEMLRCHELDRHISRRHTQYH